MYDSLIFKLFYEHYTVIVSGDGGGGVQKNKILK